MKPIINIVLLGKGNVGSAWLELFTEQKSRYENIAQVRVVAIANSARFYIKSDGVNTSEMNQFPNQAQVGNLSELTRLIAQLHLDNVIVLDITASKSVADQYLEFAELGWNIISANKIPLTKSSERYKTLVNKLREQHSYWGINATVGAALPIQSSLHELIQAGDRIDTISGVFSGSLSYLLVNYDGKQSFTELVKKACEAGITEPDPRDDLSGIDVQRKLLILSRVAGHIINLSDIQVKPLLPEAFMKGTIVDFWQQHEEIDAYMVEQFNKANEEGKKLCYLGQISFINKIANGKVGLESLSQNNAVTQLKPSDNVFTLKTDFYRENSLIIRGPGAGAIVTATAVNIDLNKFITQVALATELTN